jgi:hypothetical protein
MKTTTAAPPADLDECARIIPRLVHFASKPINSNAGSIGVRLGPRDRLDLPAIAARTLLPVPLDYAAFENGRPATVVKQLKAAERAEEPTQEQIDLLRLAEEAEQTPHEVGTAAISPRLRQILIERDGETLALVPLACPGLADLIAARAETVTPRPRRATLPLGGANPQNVCGRSDGLRRPLVYDAPRENPDLRRAFAIHHAGITLDPNLAPYAEFHAEAKTWTAAAKQRERELLAALLAPILRRAERARTLLTACADTLGGNLLAPTVDPVIRGLIDPESRRQRWRRRFGVRIARLIADRVKCDGTEAIRIAARIASLLP